MKNKMKVEMRICYLIQQAIVAIYEMNGDPEMAIGYAMAAIKADTENEIDINLVHEYYNDAISQIGKL